MTLTRKTRVFVELDTLFDSRIAVVNHMNPNMATKLVSNLKYHSRHSDDFTKIVSTFDKYGFIELYKNRTKEMLMGKVYPTPMGAFISNLVSDNLIADVASPANTFVHVTINTYPYKFDVIDNNVLKEIMEDRFLCSVKIVSMLPDFVSPTYLKKHVDQYIIYDFNSWITMHIDELKDVPIPTVVMYAPPLIAKYTKDCIKNLVNWSAPIMMQQNFSEHIALHFLNTDLFSFHVEPAKKNTKGE